MIKDINAASWDSDVANVKGIVVVEFWHQQCIWCQRLAPVYDALSGEYKDVTFAKFDILKDEANGSVGEKYGIQGTPTIKVFCNGRESGEIVGYAQKEALKEKLDSIIAESGSCIEKSTPAK